MFMSPHMARMTDDAWKYFGMSKNQACVQLIKLEEKEQRTPQQDWDQDYFGN